MKIRNRLISYCACSVRATIWPSLLRSVPLVWCMHFRLKRFFVRLNIEDCGPTPNCGNPETTGHDYSLSLPTDDREAFEIAVLFHQKYSLGRNFLVESTETLLKGRLRFILGKHSPVLLVFMDRTISTYYARGPAPSFLREESDTRLQSRICYTPESERGDKHCGRGISEESAAAKTH
jgi:hypothetical protein